MDDITTLADLIAVLARQGGTIQNCRIFTTYDGGLSPFAAVGVARRGNRDLSIKFKPFDDVLYDWQVSSLSDVLALAKQHRLNHRECRIHATIDDDETELLVATMSIFNGSDVHLTFKPAPQPAEPAMQEEVRRVPYRELEYRL